MRRWLWPHDHDYDLMRMIMTSSKLCSDNQLNNYDVMIIIMISWQWLGCHDNDWDVMTMIAMSWQLLRCHNHCHNHNHSQYQI